MVATFRRHWPDLAVVCALVGITLWRLVPAIDSTTFHRDEARWIGNSAILREWRNPFGIRWQDEGYVNQYGSRDESNRRRDQPPLAMYLIGIGLVLQGEGLPELGYWIMSYDDDWNAEQGNMPSKSELRAARRTSVATALLTVIAIYAIGTLMTNRFGGMAAALIFAAHPLVVTTSARAWGDPLLVLCIALAALAAFRFGDRPTWGRSAVLGVAFGLGAAAKLSPILMSAALGLFGVALAPAGGRGPMGRDAALREFGRKLAAVPVFAFATFLALYPYLWRNPILHTFRMFEFRTESFRLQAIDSPAKVTNRGDAFRRIGVELGDRFSTSGELIEWLGIEGVSSLRYLDLILAVAGLLFLTAIVIRDGVLSPRSLTVAVVGGHALLVVLTIEVEFARYLLPVVLLVAKAAGTTLGVVQEACMRPWSRRRVRSPSPQLVRSDTTA